MDRVKGRVVLLAGADDCIGEATALRLARLGALLALCDKESGTLETLAAEINKRGGVAKCFATDIKDWTGVESAVARVLDEFGAIDILVNNPKAPPGKQLTDLSAEDFSDTVGSNVYPPFYFIRHTIPAMRNNGRGRIVNVSRIDYLGIPGKTNLAASRSALFGLTRSIALEVAKNDITVNTVVAGDIEARKLPDGEIDNRISSIPVKRLGTPEDIARTVCFFASDSSKYMTGQTFFVCGGQSVHFSMSV